jgi:hypothetical protein
MFLTVTAALLMAAAHLAPAQTAAGVAGILARPQPLSDVAPSGAIPRIAKAPDVQPIQARQAQALLDGHLAPDLKLASGPGAGDVSWQIGTDGQSVMFVNRAAYKITDVSPRAARASNEELRAAATDFLEQKLLKDSAFKSLFPLGPKEDLKLTDSYSRVATVYSPEEATTQLMSRAFVFTRYYAGVPILGPGHKVVVIMTPAKVIAGIQILLPRIVDSGAQRKIVSREVFKARALAEAKPSSGDAFFNQEIRGIRCGYFDPIDPAKPRPEIPAAAYRDFEPVCYVSRVVDAERPEVPLTRLVVSIDDN